MAHTSGLQGGEKAAGRMGMSRLEVAGMAERGLAHVVCASAVPGDVTYSLQKSHPVVQEVAGAALTCSDSFHHLDLFHYPVFLPVLRHVGGAVRGDLRAAVAGQRGTGSCLPGEIPGRGGGHQESEGSERDGHQAPAEAQASQHYCLQVGCDPCQLYPGKNCLLKFSGKAFTIQELSCV